MIIQPQGGCVISTSGQKWRNRVAVWFKPFHTQGSRSDNPGLKGATALRFGSSRRKTYLSKTVTIPELALVVLVGPSGSGKSTFAKKHFKSTEVLSSDFCRGLVSDDENDQAATNTAFEVLHFIAGRRLARGNLTVVDATNVQAEARKPLVAVAREYHVLPVAIVFNLSERLCQDRNQGRADRNFGPHVIRNQTKDLRRSLKQLKREGFRHVHIL